MSTHEDGSHPLLGVQHLCQHLKEGCLGAASPGCPDILCALRNGAGSVGSGPGNPTPIAAAQAAVAPTKRRGKQAGLELGLRLLEYRGNQVVEVREDSGCLGVDFSAPGELHRVAEEVDLSASQVDNAIDHRSSGSRYSVAPGMSPLKSVGSDVMSMT
jgi:hypothetical protein